MQEEQIIQEKIDEFSKTIRIRKIEEGFIRAISYGSVIFLLSILAETIFPISLNIYLLAIFILLGSISVGLFLGMSYKITPLKAAQMADRWLRLKERTSTATEFLNKKEEFGLSEALIKDAAIHIRRVASSQVCPLTIPREIRYLPWIVIGLATIILFANLLLPRWKEERVLRQTIREEGRRLEEIGRALEEKAKQRDLQETMKITPKLRALGEEMKEGKLSEPEAISKLSRLSQETRLRSNSLAARAPLQSGTNVKRTQQTAQQNASLSSGLAQALQQGDESSAIENLEKMMSNLEQGKMSPEEAKKLSEQLEEAKEQLEGDQGLSEMLARAAEALAQGDVEGAREALQQALEQLSKQQRMSEDRETLEMLQRALERSQGNIQNGDNRPIDRDSGFQDMLERMLMEGGQENNGGARNKDGRESWESDPNLKDEGNAPGTAAQPKGQKGPPSERIETSKKTDKIEGEIADEKARSLSLEVKAPSDNKEGAKIPLEEAYPQYKKKAEEALSAEEIPAGYKWYVKKYFESLEEK